MFDLADEKNFLDEIVFANNFLECCESFVFKGKIFFLLTTCDNYVHVFEVDRKFLFLNSLPGHTNKIMSLSVDRFS